VAGISNLTAMQFRASYKRPLIHNEIKAINGNVTMQDNTKILTVSSSLGKKAAKSVIKLCHNKIF